METNVVNVNGGELFYADYPGTQGTIVAVHGLTGNHKQMHYYAQLLKGDYRFISVDLKGRGNSGQAPENTSIEQHTKDILVLLEQLEIENPILMGYSMGAFIMANVASKRSDVKGVILLDGAATATDHQRNIIEPSLGRISKLYESAQSYIDEIKGIYGRLGVEWTDHIESVGHYEIGKVDGYWKNKSDEAKIRQDLESFFEYEPSQVFSNIYCPILLIHSEGNIGTNPALFLAEHYSKTLQFAKNIHKFTSPSNHYTLVFSNRPEVNKAIVQFLKNL
ncbi:alpha/beta fold hydrolase [Lysinibacillus halotolerans]|uniref:Alpha/beta hydrolase n=1 Tax=Lysinibacillus halotolerans TaxID=1368476 RepID=A0A3M8H9S7_9BACI|nr:alpha/beta hydrolase [Lysinibacillus halotolerans]RNC98994.1 alpha/beta hydrolase [Lysinibacillus halotolerans]